MATVILPIILFFIMFSMGLAITITDFKNVAKFPKAFSIGFLLQLVSLPAIAFSIAYLGFSLFSLPAAMCVGIIIIAACPGGVTSNLLTHLGGGDTALSIALTATMSIVSAFTIPLIVNVGLILFMGQDSDTYLDVTKSTVQIFIITVVPVLFGMFIKFIKSDFADWLEPYARKVATAFFCLIVFAVVAKNAKILISASAMLIPLIILFNILTMMLAYGVSRSLKLAQPQQIAITLECGMQNGTMAIVIALTLLRDTDMMIPGAIYSIVMFATASLFLWRANRKISPLSS